MSNEEINKPITPNARQKHNYYVIPAAEKITKSSQGFGALELENY